MIHLVVGDVPFGEGFPLTPWSAPITTPHLYAHWPIALALEALAVVACIAVVLPIFGRRRAAILLAALLAMHLFAWLPSFASQPPVDLAAEPLRIVVYLAMLLAAWVACVLAAPRSPA